MMRLLFLSLLLLPAATAVIYDNDFDEGSGNEETDDEDLIKNQSRSHVNTIQDKTTELDESSESRSHVNTIQDKTTGLDESSDKMTLIVIVAVATVLTLSMAAIGTIMLVKRQMRLRQQAIYTVPTEQNQKEAI